MFYNSAFTKTSAFCNFLWNPAVCCALVHRKCHDFHINTQSWTSEPSWLHYKPFVLACHYQPFFLASIMTPVQHITSTPILQYKNHYQTSTHPVPPRFFLDTLTLKANYVQFSTTLPSHKLQLSASFCETQLFAVPLSIGHAMTFI